jgi:hypothetical protein
MKVSQPVDNEDVIEILDDEVEDIHANIINNSFPSVSLMSNLKMGYPGVQPKRRYIH